MQNLLFTVTVLFPYSVLPTPAPPDAGVSPCLAVLCVRFTAEWNWEIETAFVVVCWYLKICDSYCERVTAGELKSNKELHLCSVTHGSRAKSDGKCRLWHVELIQQWC